MKLSFSLPSRPRPATATGAGARAVVDLSDSTDGEDRTPQLQPQQITIFDPSQTLATAAAARVIPPLPNSTNLLLHRARIPSSIPDAAAAADAEDADFANSFVSASAAAGGSDDSGIRYGLTLRSPNSNSDRPAADASIDDLMLRRFKEDMRNLPEGGIEQFSDVPVEGFGVAILAGYGWSEGQAVGRKKGREDTKVVQYDRRGGTEGLGFDPAATGIKKSRRGDWVIYNGDGHKAAAVQPKASSPPASREKKQPLAEEEAVKQKKDRKERKGVESHKSEDVSRAGAERWLRSHIRVRIVSKKFSGGKFYLKKGKVVDVVGPTTCDIIMDESGEFVQRVDQEVLETALPKRGGPVLVLFGKRKGVYGTLLDRDSGKDMGSIRDADTHEVINVRLEQIAEYVGDPADLGY